MTKFMRILLIKDKCRTISAAATTMGNKRVWSILAVVTAFVTIASGQLPPPGGGSTGSSGSTGSTSGGSNPPDWVVFSKHPYFYTYGTEAVQAHLGGSSYVRYLTIYDPDLSLDLNNPLGGIYPARYEHQATFSIAEAFDSVNDYLFGNRRLTLISTSKVDSFGLVTVDPFPANPNQELLPGPVTVTGANTAFTISYRCPVVTEQTAGTYYLSFEILDQNAMDVLNDSKDWEIDPETNIGSYVLRPDSYTFSVGVTPGGADENRLKNRR